MNFTKLEQTVIQELEKRAGEVLYLDDIAPYFISKSYFTISTYTQLAYIQIGDTMQNALSEYFQCVVFLKKMEENGICFSIPYTPLEDNPAEIGNPDFKDYQQQTIADGDLLIQLFQYAGKKYLIMPNASARLGDTPKQSKINFIIPSIVLLFLFMLIGTIGYQSYKDHKKQQLKQEVIRADMDKQSQNIEWLKGQAQREANMRKEIQKKINTEFKLINNSLESQNQNLRSLRYWNRKQSVQLERLIQTMETDSVK